MGPGFAAMKCAARFTATTRSRRILSCTLNRVIMFLGRFLPTYSLKHQLIHKLQLARQLNWFQHHAPMLPLVSSFVISRLLRHAVSCYRD